MDEKKSQFTALYRKYRPQNFDEVLDQDHIVKVLKGAIEKDQVPHALLFSGGRGTGKTTVARIFASAIGAGPMDIYEIDAASNRGIEDVRELREAVHTLPYESERKVYIIDEVHMLTKDAFNALLKTLEEPPAHVVFILATTEEDKILDTILSRCQVFRFRSPSRTVLKKAVIDIAKAEGFTLKSEAAELIAIAADGSFRDALGVTQKVILSSGDDIGDSDEVADIIGAPRKEILNKLMDSLANKDLQSALKAVDEAVAVSINMKIFTRLLLERVRAVILLRYVPDQADKLLEGFGVEEQEKIRKYAKESATSIHSHLLVRLLDAALYNGLTDLPQIPLELALIDTFGESNSVAGGVARKDK